MTLSDIGGRATVSIPEAAELLGVGRSAAYEAARRGEIPTLRLGRRLLVPVPRLLALLGAEEAGQALAEGPAAEVNGSPQGREPSPEAG